MKNAQLRLIFTLASLCTIGIITAQIYGVRSAYNQENERFDLNVTVALKEVAFKVWDFKQSQSTIYNVVNRTSSDYYLVKINENVDEGVPEYFLKESFAKTGFLQTSYLDYTTASIILLNIKSLLVSTTRIDRCTP